MKKVFLGIVVLLITMGIAYAQGATDLDSALERSSRDIAAAVPVNSKIAVAAFFSDSENLSSYLVQEMSKNLMQSGTLTVLERSERNNAIVNAEMEYQYSGSVSDDSMVDYGKRMGARYLVYGTFDQFGGMLQVTIQLTDVESGEIPYMMSWSISKTSRITDLLGDEMELINAEDYLEAIARCQRKINSIEKDKAKAIQNQSSRIYASYQEKINQITSEEKPPYESKAEYNKRINEAVSSVERMRDTELSGVEKSVGIKYDSQSKQVEIQQDKLVKDLQNTVFSLKGDSVQVMLGAFDAESKPKNWPVSLKSLDKQLSYTYNGKYIVNDADVKTEYQEIELARTENGFEGEINYRLVQGSTKNSFDVFIVSIRVYIKNTGLTIVNENLNVSVGRMDANKIATGTPAKNQKKNKQDSSAAKSAQKNTVSAEKKATSSYVAEETISSVSSAGRREKPVWVSNNFSIGYTYIGNMEFASPIGISLGAFNTTLGNFYIDWVNANIAIGSSTYFDVSLDLGLYIRMAKRFFPFVEAGIGFYYVTGAVDSYGLYTNQYVFYDYEDGFYDMDGILLKTGLGFDIKISEKVKLTAEYDLRFLTASGAVVADCVKIGVTLGKPKK
ncbi:MAG: hypothetical protein K6E78_00450 [Treponema sp.]|nr:hypothetical protein [Treponema sp.]